MNLGAPSGIALHVNGSQRAVIDSSGRLLVGTSTARNNFYNTTGTGPSFQIEGADNNPSSMSLVCNFNGNTNGPALIFGKSNSTALGSNTLTVDGNNLGRILFSGNDGTEFVNAAEIKAEVDGTPGANDMPGRLVFSTTADGASSPTERMRITSSGNIGIGATSITNTAGFGRVTEIAGLFPALTLNQTDAGYVLRKYSLGVDALGSFSIWDNNAGAYRITVNTSGSVSIAGALSKGSGSFRIDHPLPEKTNTHQLVHSFIEGPQADLIYRGHVALKNGTVTINIDTAARMTEGTFEALCQNVCCFTSNESDWTAVKGSVAGNILTIESQDQTSNAEVCWMVIGERKDKHMLETDWTDETGRVITEPLKQSAPKTT
jgi:hypothetical protein